MSKTTKDNDKIYISRFSAWAPGVENAKEWEEWALGKRDISVSSDSPGINFTEPKFRRRLSQISKMTIQVVHDLLPVREDSKIIFLSFRGEISQQFKVNKMLIEDNAILPAAFSISAFNASVAIASMAFGLKGGYSAIFPGGNSFTSGLLLSEAAFHDTETQELIFIYADEEVPPEYSDIFPGKHFPLAFAFLLAREPGDFSIPLSSLKMETDTPDDFLKRLILLRRNCLLSC